MCKDPETEAGGQGSWWNVKVWPSGRAGCQSETGGREGSGQKRGRAALVLMGSLRQQGAESWAAWTWEVGWISRRGRVRTFGHRAFRT